MVSKERGTVQSLGGHEEGRLIKEYFVNGRYVDVVILAIFRPGEEPKSLST